MRPSVTWRTWQVSAGRHAYQESATVNADVKGEAARLAEGNRMAYSRAKDRYLHALEQTALRSNESPRDQ